MEIIKEKAEAAVRNAGKLFSQGGGDKKYVEKEGTANFATIIDYNVQEFLTQRLNDIIPGCNIVSEESSDNSYNTDKPTWVMDPVDGTINLFHGLPHSCISLGLFLEGQPAIGIIYNPYTDEMFSASSGKGAYLNGKPIRVSKTSSLGESLIVHGFMAYDRSRAAQEFKIAERVFRSCQDIRTSGSSALDIAYTACGRFDGFYYPWLQPWDYAAGLVIIKEAGGRITDWQGKNIDKLIQSSAMASNGLIHQEIQDMLVMD